MVVGRQREQRAAYSGDGLSLLSGFDRAGCKVGQDGPTFLSDCLLVGGGTAAQITHTVAHRDQQKPAQPGFLYGVLGRLSSPPSTCVATAQSCG